MIRVVIADDLVLLKESLSYILNHEDDIEVVGLAGNGKEAVKLCRTLRPNVVLMDIEMPEMDGVKATFEIKKYFPEIRVIMLTTFENSDNIMESFVSGADGYVVKNINHNDLVLAVKCVSSGLTVIHESVKQIMIDRFRGLTSHKTKEVEKLSTQEIDIVKLIATGKSNRDIASTLNYSEGTIKNKISKIFDKLDISDRMHAAIFAIENGLV